MKPIHTRAVDHLKIIFINRARRDGISRVSVHPFGKAQPVPMDDGGIGKFVLEPNLDSLTLFDAKNWTEL